MKKIFFSILAIAGLISLSSCDNDLDFFSKSEGVRMILKTDSAELITRATEEGVDALNENKIQTIHYYFFDITDGSYVYDNTQTVNKSGEADIALSGINETKFDEIFSSRTSLNVLVVVNATTPAGTSTTTKDAIKATAVTLSGFGKQDNFVMVGEGTLTKTDNKKAETNEISLKRLASKITLHLVIPNEYEDEAHKVWIPQLDDVQIDFNKLGKNILVCGEKTSSPVLGNATRKSTSSDFELKDVTDGKELSLTVPVYSYPLVWSNGDEDTPFIYITLPWEMDDESKTADTYYKLLLSGSSLESNTWYDITAKLGGLGSLVKEGTTTIDDLNIKVSRDWKDAIPAVNTNTTDAELLMPRVLAVEKNTYVIYNQDEIEIPFVSSHNCTVELDDDTIKYSHPDSMGVQQKVTVKVDNDKKVIRFTHVLDNDQSSKPYDYLVFKAQFTLQHADDPNYSEIIYIEQRPALCVEAFDNSNGWENVFVGRNQLTSDGVTLANSTKYWAQLQGSSNNNNVYKVTASVLSGSFQDYKIGDPRIRTQNQLNFEPFNNNNYKDKASDGKSLLEIQDSNGHYLTYYYTAGTSTSDIIAPSFRICSSFGGTGTTNFSDPYDKDVWYKYYQLRCAAYQEAGYPAGRWRLPTDAELKFCLQLQADGCLGTKIFNEAGKNKTPTYYFSASGNGYGVRETNEGVKDVLKAGTNDKVTNIRCVYDAWYWDNSDEAEGRLSPLNNGWEKFTWGDVPISW